MNKQKNEYEMRSERIRDIFDRVCHEVLRLQHIRNISLPISYVILNFELGFTLEL